MNRPPETAEKPTDGEAQNPASCINRSDLILMAREAEAWNLIDHDGIAALERFAALVAAHEREECAKVCETMARRTNDIRRAALEMAVENIMARGQA